VHTIPLHGFFTALVGLAGGIAAELDVWCTMVPSGRRGSISSTASAGPSGNLYRSIDNYILANIAQWEAMEAAGRAFVVPQGSGCLTDVPTSEQHCTLAENHVLQDCAHQDMHTAAPFGIDTHFLS
jgi:hypothetical protein